MHLPEYFQTYSSSFQLDNLHSTMMSLKLYTTILFRTVTCYEWKEINSPDLIEIVLPLLSITVNGSCLLSVEHRRSNSIRKASEPRNKIVKLL